MNEINKEVYRDNEQENELSLITEACRDKLRIKQQHEKPNSPMDDDSDESSNIKSPDSAIGGILSVESCISNPESVFSSPYCESDASPSTGQENESPYAQDPITPGLELQNCSTLNVRVQPNEVQNITKENQALILDQRKPQYSREQEQLGKSLVAESRSPGTEIREHTECTRNILKVIEYKEHLQGNWKYLKKTIDYTMVQSFEKVGLVREDEFRRVKLQRRSKVADMLVMRIIQKIENTTDIMNFENTIGQPVCDKLTTRQAKYFRTEDKVKLKNWNLLSSNRPFMIQHLMTDDIENVKDLLVQEFIINIDENDQITNEYGFCERQNTKFTEYFVDKFIIGKSLYGSYQCLIEYLEMLCKNGKHRLRELLRRLKTDNINNTDACMKGPIVSLSVLPIGYKDMSTERYRSTTGKNLELKVKFTEDDDAEKKKIYKEVIDKAKTKNGYIGRELDACIDNADFGSIVIHMVALREEMIQTVIDKIRNGQFSAVVKLLLNDLKIKRYLPTGKHELEVTCSLADKKKNLRYFHKSNPIADNKSFLEEEMDTIYVLKELEKHGVHIGIDVNDGDREFRVRHIMTKALAEKTIAITLHKVLLEGEMVNVKNRLLKYKTVYESDSSQLQEHIFKHFQEIIRKVFLEDIRRIFTERNIFKDEMFEAAEKSGERHEIAMANILTEIIKMGTDAMLTLVDALYVIQLDKLAEKLMKREQLDDDDRMKRKAKCDAVYINKQIHGESSDTNLLAMGRYELTVRRRKRTNKKRCAATKRSTVLQCTPKIKQPKMESGTLPTKCLYDVQDLAFFCLKERSLQSPVSAAYIGLSYQQPDTGTNYDMRHPRNRGFDIACYGLHAPSYTTTRDPMVWGLPSCAFSSNYSHKGPYTAYQRDLSCRFSNADSCSISRTYTTNASHTAIDCDLWSWRTNTSIEERRESFMAIDEGECNNDVRILNNSDNSLEIAWSPASTTCTTDSGYSTNHEEVCDTNRIHTPDSTYRPCYSAHHDEDDQYNDIIYELDEKEKPIIKAGQSNHEEPSEFEIDSDLILREPFDVLFSELVIKENKITQSVQRNDDHITDNDVGINLLVNAPSDVNIQELGLIKNQTTEAVQQSDDNITEFNIGNNPIIDVPCNQLPELVIKKTQMIRTWEPNDEKCPEVKNKIRHNLVINVPAEHICQLVLKDHSQQ